MKYFYYVLAVYLTYYTFTYALMCWKKGIKLGSIPVFLLSLVYAPLTFIIARMNRF